ncbi:hypothetical protein [Streptomyces sp. MMG1522]|uniref:hypothetical protein n=1 Tax=Streptomyces sp. MMG1522 TaxID=1415545 RepID=UPI000A780EE4|nr:hypothetical protein [Streptomyces sp. MMG1522]
MAVQNSVSWADLDPAKIENMISVLISRLHTEVQRIDGSGGDGGRDVQVPLESGLVIYEVKSFTGRLSKSRKAQIKRSLKKAKTHRPRVWHLVMPLDLTPGELVWYNGLKSDYPFVSDFTRGRTWLDSEMACRSDIARYYVGDSNSEIISSLREIREEEAGLANGVTDAVSRVRRVVSRLNEIDPHYKFGLHISADGIVKTEVFPRYPGAELDRPIVVKAKFAFPRTPEGEAAAADFRDSIDYGVPVELPEEFVQSLEVDAPAGMGGVFPGGALTISSIQPETDHGIRYAVVATDVHGRPLATLPLVLAKRFLGGRGAQLELSDITGFFTLQARISVTEREGAFTFGFAHRDDVLPSALLPTIRFLLYLKAGNQWGLSVNGEVNQLHHLPETYLPEISPYGRYVKALVKLQDYANYPFPIPRDLADSDARNLRMAIHLIEGNNLTSSWSRAGMTLTKEGVETWRAITGTDARQILIQEDFYTDICGNHIYVGQVRRHIASARVEELPLVEAMDAECDEFPVALIPGQDDTVTVSLVPREEDSL